MLNVKKSFKLAVLFGCLTALSMQNVSASMFNNLFKNKKIVYGLLTAGVLVGTAYFVNWVLKKDFKPVAAPRPVSVPSGGVSVSLTSDDTRPVEVHTAASLVDQVSEVIRPFDFSKISFSERIGRSALHPMEDRTDINTENADFDFIGIYDGHGGSFYSEKLKLDFREFLLERISHQVSHVDLSPIIRESFIRFNELMFQQMERVPQGSCAITAILDKSPGGLLYVANVGDSRAILVNKDGSITELSHDFKTLNPTPSELARITAAGGSIIEDRLSGILAVTRAFGDFSLNGITAEPEIMVANNRQLQNADFLVVGCDGVWDGRSNRSVAEFCRTNFVPKEFGNLAKELTRDIKSCPVDAHDTHLVYCDDDLSVVVVKLSR